MTYAVVIENLSKRFLISHERRRAGYRTLRESLVELAGLPLRRLRGQRPATTEEFWALKDVNLKIQSGEVVGIIGRNGAGKSTLLKILSRITKPTRGSVRIHGRVGSLLEVGTGFHPELTGRENIYLSGSILGMRKREIAARFDEIVNFAEIEQFLDTPVKRYSSGMYVRLAFAVAAHLDPEILIVDEVLAVGDAAFQKKCLSRVGRLAEDGKTVLVVSHNLPMIATLCSTGVLLDHGNLVSRGKANEVLADYERLGGGTGEIHQHVSPHLRWLGLANRGELGELAPSDDLVLKLRFATSGQALESVQVDIALHNENGVQVIHARSPLVTSGFAIPRSTTLDIRYAIRRPNLAPGKYLLTVYAYSGREVLCWVDNIDACSVTAESHGGSGLLLSSLQGVIVPPFEVSIAHAESPALACGSLPRG